MGLGVASKKVQALIPAEKVDGPRLRNIWKIMLDHAESTEEREIAGKYDFANHYQLVKCKFKDIKEGEIFILDYFDSDVVWKASKDAVLKEAFRGNESIGQQWSIVAKEFDNRMGDNGEYYPGLTRFLHSRTSGSSNHYKIEESNQKTLKEQFSWCSKQEAPHWDENGKPCCIPGWDYSKYQNLGIQSGEAYTEKVIR